MVFHLFLHAVIYFYYHYHHWWCCDVLLKWGDCGPMFGGLPTVRTLSRSRPRKSSPCIATASKVRTSFFSQCNEFTIWCAVFIFQSQPSTACRTTAAAERRQLGLREQKPKSWRLAMSWVLLRAKPRWLSLHWYSWLFKTRSLTSRRGRECPSKSKETTRKLSGNSHAFARSHNITRIIPQDNGRSRNRPDQLRIFSVITTYPLIVNWVDSIWYLQV